MSMIASPHQYSPHDNPSTSVPSPFSFLTKLNISRLNINNNNNTNNKEEYYSPIHHQSLIEFPSLSSPSSSSSPAIDHPDNPTTITHHRYEGEWSDHNKNGKGVFYYANGDKYAGEWKDGVRNGKGIYYFKNGNRYEGEWKDDMMHGKGVYYYADGGKYEGEYKEDKPNGKGIYYYAKSGDRYEGEFKDGDRHGKGIIYYANGDKYDGEWKNDKKNGKGIYYFKNGDHHHDKFARIRQLNSLFTSFQHSLQSSPSVLLIGSADERKSHRLTAFNHQYARIEAEIHKNRGAILIGDQRQEERNNNNNNNNSNRFERLLSLNNAYNQIIKSIEAGPSVPLRVDSAPLLPSALDKKSSALLSLLMNYETILASIQSSPSVPLIAEPLTTPSPTPAAVRSNTPINTNTTTTTTNHNNNTNNNKIEKDSTMEEEKSFSCCPVNRCPISILCRSTVSLYNAFNNILHQNHPYSTKHLLDCIPLSPTIAAAGERMDSFDSSLPLSDDRDQDETEDEMMMINHSDNESDRSSIMSQEDRGIEESGPLSGMNQSTQSLDLLLPDEESIEEDHSDNNNNSNSNNNNNNNEGCIRCVTSAFEPHDPMRFWLVDQMKNSANYCCR